MQSKHLIYNNLKKRYLALFLIFFTITAFGQSNFYKLSGGIGGGGTYTFTDVKKGSFGYGAYGALDYHFTPFITGGLELQMGLAKGGNKDTDPYNREFTNAFKAVALNFKFRAGEFTDFYYSDFLNYTKGFYLGTGLGFVQSHMNSIVRYKARDDGSTYTFPGDDKGSSVMVPVNLGIDFYFPDSWGDIRYIFNVNYQTNFVFADNFDGYNDPKNQGFKNVSPDMYNFLSIGIKYTFGPKGITRKTIR